MHGIQIHQCELFQCTTIDALQDKKNTVDQPSIISFRLFMDQPVKADRGEERPQQPADTRQPLSVWRSAVEKFVGTFEHNLGRQRMDAGTRLGVYSETWMLGESLPDRGRYHQRIWRVVQLCRHVQLEDRGAHFAAIPSDGGEMMAAKIVGWEA